MVELFKLPAPVNLVFTKYQALDSDQIRSPIVILHGIFSCKEHWTKLPKLLAEQSKRIVYIMDLRDHGQSPWTNDLSYKSFVSDIIHFFVQNHIQKAIIIGHSLGGMIAARFATLFPNLIEKLVMIDIHAKKERYRDEDKPNVIQQLAKHFKKSIETVRNENLDFEKAKIRLSECLESEVKDQKMRKGLLFLLNIRDDWKFNLSEIDKFLETMYEIEDIEPNYNGPCLLIYGTASIFFEQKDCQSMKALFPNIEFDYVDNADHSLVFTHSNEFLSKTVQFLNVTEESKPETVLSEIQNRSDESASSKLILSEIQNLSVVQGIRSN